MKKRFRLRSFWAESSKLTKTCGLVASVGAVIAMLYSGYSFAKARTVEHLGKPPYQSRADAEAQIKPLIEFAADSLIASQIGLQTQIEILAQKCGRGECKPYEQEVLKNLRAQWQRNQEQLNKLRPQQQTR